MSDDQVQPADFHDPLSDTYTLPTILRQWRDSAGWTQDQLAAKSGVSQKTISAIETGTSPEPHDGTLMKFAEAFGYHLGIAPAAMFQDLVAARERKPTDIVSHFAKRLDNLLQGHPAPVRLFYEEMIMEFYLKMVKINEQVTELYREQRRKKNQGSKPG